MFDRAGRAHRGRLGGSSIFVGFPSRGLAGAFVHSGRSNGIERMDRVTLFTMSDEDRRANQKSGHCFMKRI